MVILPIASQEVYRNVPLLPIGNRTPTTLFFLYIYIYIYLEPIILTYANVESNPSHQEAPTKLSDLKPWIFVVGFSANKQNQKKRKAFRIKDFQPPNQIKNLPSWKTVDSSHRFRSQIFLGVLATIVEASTTMRCCLTMRLHCYFFLFFFSLALALAAFSPILQVFFAWLLSGAVFCS